MAVIPIALTPGEPAGIGPDLIIKIAQQKLAAPIVVIADPDLLQERAHQLQLPFPVGLEIIAVKLTHKSIPGCLDPVNANYVIETLTLAAQGCLKGEFSALVTGPVHKGIINEAGISFSGHTEFFAELSNTSHVVMMLVADKLRVALATTHLPLRKVADAITPELLTKTLKILHEQLQHNFSISRPKILVCGLNPHAGENGHLGREEIDIIIPVLEELRAAGMNVIGPLSADTIFLSPADAILAMYHDQGLPVLKQVGFHHAVNITLGLPFIRTSVDHGTALELAGTGKADASSLHAAIEMAITLSKNRKEYVLNNSKL